MNPTRLHYFYARKWPIWLAIIIVPLLCLVFMTRVLGPAPALLPLNAASGNYLFLLGLAWFLGWALCALVGPFIFGPIYSYRARLNGAPFLPGDQAEILVGPHRGRIVQVLEALDGRGKIRVDLGEKTSSKRKGMFLAGDFFEETQLLRVVGVEQHPAG